jgi:putative MATE family efflux protein
MDAPVPPRPQVPRFVAGSTMRHVLEMTAAGSVGLIAVFAVDLLSLLYVSWLGDPRLTAGVGFATVVLFFAVSINLGFMIAIGALVSRALGAGDRAGAARLATSATILAGLSGLVVSAVLLPLLPILLEVLGASPEVRPVTIQFLWIVLPFNALMAIGMAFSGALRAIGDPKRGMYLTLVGAIVTAALDPLLIFGLRLGVPGAAISTVASRFIFVYLGYRATVRIHGLAARPSFRTVGADARRTFAVAFPAILTNLAPGISNAFFAAILARFGNEVVAASAIIDRLVPVAFGGVFALSGAVGPILGQNWGARRFDRMRRTLRDSLVFVAGYVGAVWLVLLALMGVLPLLFNSTGETADLIVFFCLVSGPVWFFLALLFVANAAFNNLGFPLLSTAFNWGRATLGTMPFAYLGSVLAGPKGALVGLGAGGLMFGVAGIGTAFWAVRRLERKAAGANPLPAGEKPAASEAVAP